MLKQYWMWWQRYWDVSRFKRQRVDYFNYLSQLLQGTNGQLTLRAVFALESQRYGLGTYRGRLATYWGQQYEQNGGDLVQTWGSLLSSVDQLVIQLGQLRGDNALAVALQLLAQQHQELKALRSQLSHVLWPVALAMLLLGSVFSLIPLFTVPELKSTFAVLPAALYGAKTRALFAMADLMRSYGLIMAACFSLGFTAVLLSLPWLVGPMRDKVDCLEPWASYKKFQVTYLFGLLSLLLNQQVAQLRLGQAIQQIAQGSDRWLAWQAQKIQTRMLQGEVGARGFATGLLPRAWQWFFEDIEQSQSLLPAISLMHQRLLDHFKKELLIKAHVWRWLLLLTCVGVMLAIGAWHYIVIDEMRRALLMFYSH
ncbi:hypothetical protein PAEH1_04215 [Paenalcaligenes hominis]|uniref:Type II secretion system protein GspF domain-containing protein n=1 Tax=Paenalcaligenes hominis TaxID=643674 RepID=A0A1U9JYW2_9BURK|nr:hypothetical protein [Paenalcaligenes hominis]AQS50972.1 hypothetical protein PAEH1_04215 [Paenalcaligenes hominis]